MVKVSFLTAEMGRLDEIRAEVLILTVFEDERPLRGLNGLVDWRTCGLLSRFLQRGHVTGARGEVVLFPLAGRLPVERGLIFGLGPVASFDEDDFRTVCEEISGRVGRLKSGSVALSLPGTQRKAFEAGEAATLFAEASGSIYSRVTFITDKERRREIAEALRRRQGEYEVLSSSPKLVGGAG